MMTSPEPLRNRPHLTVDTSPQPQPATAGDAALDGSKHDPKTPPGLRGHSDIRAPGFAKTPLNADIKTTTFVNKESINNNNNNNNNNVNSIASPTTTNNTQPEEPRSPLADFITQTDKYGNASTPRTAEAITSARKLHPEGPKPLLHVDSETGVVMEGEDAIGSPPHHHGSHEALLNKDDNEGQVGGAEDTCDTLLDSFRMMCCCLLPEDPNSNNNNGNNNTTSGTTGGDAGNKKDDHSTSSTSSKSSNPNNNHTSNNTNTSYPIGYSTRGHDAPLLLEEDSALRNNPKNIKLLPDLHYKDVGKKCLVLDLDETLVHSSFRAVPGADFVIPVQIEDVVHFVYVAKRPGVDEFLIEMAKHYEIVVYTASLNKYADVLLDLLDPHRVIRTRLFRESCVFYEGNYVKDLCLLNRDLSQCIIIDNSPASYMFHPENAIDCSSFIDDVNDRELDQIGKCLIGIKDVPDVRGTVNLWRHWPNVDLTKNHRRIR